MTPSEYLSKTLEQQNLGDESNELTKLQERRKEVEDLLRAEFGSSPTIRYGGSKSKGTLIKEAYDLDLICYFQRDDEEAGGNLETIFENVKKTLGTKFIALPKTSAIRIHGADHQDFHVDVVPGRFVDDKKADAFLHRTTGEKKRMKTNLDVHIEHVKGSGVVPAIRLSKLWRVRRGIAIRHFGLELLVIKVLKNKKSSDRETQLRHVWETLRDDVASITIEDPANPNGNDLSELLSDAVRQELSHAASQTLTSIETHGWESVFGKVPSDDEKKARVLQAAQAVGVASRPWCPR